jgi:hypothetical protein
MKNPTIKIQKTELLSDNWYPLKQSLLTIKKRRLLITQKESLRPRRGNRLLIFNITPTKKQLF